MIHDVALWYMNPTYMNSKRAGTVTRTRIPSRFTSPHKSAPISTSAAKALEIHQLQGQIKLQPYDCFKHRKLHNLCRMSVFVDNSGAQFNAQL